MAQAALSEVKQAQILVMLAQGKSHVEIAKELEIHVNTVHKYSTPSEQAKAFIEERRLSLRKRISDRLEASVEGILTQLENAAEDLTVEPKGLELITRALGNLEKVSSSVSGDNRKAAAVVTGGFTVTFQPGWGPGGAVPPPQHVDAEIVKTAFQLPPEGGGGSPAAK